MKQEDFGKQLYTVLRSRLSETASAFNCQKIQETSKTVAGKCNPRGLHPNNGTSRECVLKVT